jgi:hypothetical protein
MSLEIVCSNFPCPVCRQRLVRESQPRLVRGPRNEIAYRHHWIDGNFTGCICGEVAFHGEPDTWHTIARAYIESELRDKGATIPRLKLLDSWLATVNSVARL